MLIGKPRAQMIERRLQFEDQDGVVGIGTDSPARVDFDGPFEKGGLGRETVRERGATGFHLFALGTRYRLGFAKVYKLRKIIHAARPQISHLLFFETGQLVLRRVQLPCVIFDLAPEEFVDGTHVAAAGAEMVLDKQRDHRLNDLTRHIGVGVPVLDTKEIVSLGIDFYLFGQTLNQGFLLFRGSDPVVEIGSDDDLFDIGTAEQGSAQKVDLARHIDLDGEAFHERTQQGFEVGVDRGARFVTVMDAAHDTPADSAAECGNAETVPAAAPRAAEVFFCLRKDRRVGHVSFQGPVLMIPTTVFAPDAHANWNWG